MGPALGPPLAHVQLHGAEGVDGEPLVVVHGDTEEAGVGVDQLVLVPDYRVPEDAGVAEVGEVRHVLGTVELGRVDLADLFNLEGLGLAVDDDVDLLSLGVPVGGSHLVLCEALVVAAILDVVGRCGPLGLVRLLHQGRLQLLLDLQPGGRVGVGSGGLLHVAGHDEVGVLSEDRVLSYYSQ